MMRKCVTFALPIGSSRTRRQSEKLDKKANADGLAIIPLPRYFRPTGISL